MLEILTSDEGSAWGIYFICLNQALGLRCWLIFTGREETYREPCPQLWRCSEGRGGSSNDVQQGTSTASHDPFILNIIRRLVEQGKWVFKGEGAGITCQAEE